MPQAALLRMICAGLLLLTLLVNHAFPRMPTPHLRVLPINRLPIQLGAWRCTEEVPLDTSIYKVIPNATLLSRVYRDPAGHTIHLLLETSDDPEMFHSPMSCVPSHNANIVEMHSVSLPTVSRAGEHGLVSASELHLEADGQAMLLLYWYTSERQMDKLQALKNKILVGRSPTRLYARILVTDVANFDVAAQTARNFATLLNPSLSRLENQ